MFYKAIITFLFLSVSVSVFAQSGYIATDSSLTSGVKIIIGTRSDNANFIYVKTKDEKNKYTPEQIVEYGVQNGVKYKSVEILSTDGNKRKFFLEVLREGKFFNLYYLRNNGSNYYYLKNNLSETIKEVSKDKKDPGYLGSLLSEALNNCNYNYGKVYLSRNYLSAIVRKINEGICPNPAFKNYGIYINGSFPSLNYKSSSSLSWVSKNETSNTKALGIGAFAEFPFWKFRNLSLQLMLQYNDQQFVNGTVTKDFDQDTKINLQFFSLKALPTYRINAFSDKFKPSFFFGPAGNYYIRSVEEIIIIEKVDGWITAGPTVSESLDPVTIGGLCGIELKWFLNDTRFISLQFSYEKQFGDKISSNVFQSNLKISL